MIVTGHRVQVIIDALTVDPIAYMRCMLKYDRSNATLYISMKKLGMNPIVKDDFLYFTYNKHHAKVNMKDRLACFYEVFVKREYDHLLPASGEHLLDIGASLGDSAIYFALNGAKVHAYEPYLGTYKKAKQNIEGSGIQNIEIINAGIGNEGVVNLDGEISDTVDCGLTQKGNIETQIFSLEQVVKKHDLNEALLKCDCEGHENEIILGSSNEILRRFKRMAIEYHFGSEKIMKKLEDAGFAVKKELKTDVVINGTRTVIGMIYATKK